MKKAFSLIELLISLIIISLLIAAFTPMITKKLKASDITVGSFGKGDNVSTNITRSPTKEDCDAVGALFIPAAFNGENGRSICVTKYNVGDIIDEVGVPLADSVETVNIDNGESCSAENSSKGLCCFVGTTANECSDTGNGSGQTYSGCNRTVCQHRAANLSCANYAPGNTTIGQWRMPTKDEAIAWSNNLDILQKNKENDGLLLCDWATNLKGSVKCSSNQKCNGAGDGYCRGNHVWLSTGDGTKYFTLGTSDGIAGVSDTGYNQIIYANSARCVLDNVVEELKVSNKKPSNNYDDEDEYYDAEAPSPEFCEQFDSLYIPAKWSGSTDMCVTKYNVGDVSEDGSGPTLTNDVVVVGAGIGCSSGTCCWKGRTTPTCTEGKNGTGENVSTYSGCTRTVCQWQAASTSCIYWKPRGMSPGLWRLPTSAEVAAWANYLNNIQKNQGKNGLQLCDASVGYGSDQCKVEGNACIGASSNSCHTNHMWMNGTGTYYYLSNGTITVVNNNIPNYGFSARCVYTGKPNTVSMETSKDMQRICDKYNSLYLPPKYTGSSDGMCVTKYNVGDDGGPTYSNYAALGISVVGATTSCSNGKCCWQGRTTPTCTSGGNGNSTYSGCNRTVCQWQAAKILCENWNPDGDRIGKWRLPTSSEVAIWASYVDQITRYQGTNGLQLCDASVGYGSDQCRVDGNACIGASSNSCHTNHMWMNGTGTYYYLSNGTITVVNNNIPNYGFGARCVSTEVLKE